MLASPPPKTEPPLPQASDNEKAPDVEPNSPNNESSTETKYFTTVTTIEITETTHNDDNLADDIVILRKDPTTKRSLINKSAYAKLHRTLSPTRSSTIDNLKEKYEGKKPDLLEVNSPKEDAKTEVAKENQGYTSKRTTPVKLDEETLQSLKNKYSPGSFGYPRAQKNSRLPVPKPRATVKSQIILPPNKQTDRSRLRYSLDVGKRPKDENSNEVQRKNSSSSGEFISIITRSESEASVDKFEKELSLFEMDKSRDKKRTSSFKKLFSGRIFGKDKKKKEEKAQRKDVADNLHNETFNRTAANRHTTDCSMRKPQEVKVTRSESERFSQPKKVVITKDMEEKYAQMHISQFNHIKQAFENHEPASPPPQGYVRMDKPLAKANPGPTNYMNLPNVKKYIDTSSSASTLESDKSNLYQNTTKEQANNKNEAVVKFDTISRDTVPRAQEMRQGVRLVNPKALIPINSERPLPNPYHDNSDGRNQLRPRFEETYGTVFDSVEYDKENREARRTLSRSSDFRTIQKPPKSPSLESTKLKLPSNREIIPLSPRMKSPIPHDDVSTEKIIATELLKPTKTPPLSRKNTLKPSSPSHQNLEIDIDYPDHINMRSHDTISTKPPLSRLPLRRSPEVDNLTKQLLSQRSPSFDNVKLNQSTESIYRYRSNQALETPEKVTTNAVVHGTPPRGRTPTPNNLLQNRSLSPLRPQSVRSSTPVDALSNSPSAKSSPQKEDMRRSVEAYYWKEIKKLKEQENYDLYLYQMQMLPYGYAEDPVTVRRSRSLSPTTQRNSRRSLSLPREPKNPPKEENPYGSRIQPQPIPEGRALVNQQIPQRYQPVPDYQLNFRRNTPERRTIDVVTRSNNSLYKPIFKRGSLTTPVQEYSEDYQNKKVSFSNSRANPQSLNSWPTKNGYTQSPPQRRMDQSRKSTLEDDVFLPPTPRTPYEVQEIYGYTNKPPNVLYEYRQPPNGIYQATKPASNLRYGQDDSDSQSVILRQNPTQIQEPLYGQRQVVSRRMSYDNANLLAQRRTSQEPQYANRQQVPRFKREIIVTDEIYGQFGGYIPQSPAEERYLRLQNPVYSSRQSVAEPVYVPKQVNVREKVCDMYGQIHDRDSPSLTSPKRTGIIIGELQRSPGSPQVVRQAPNERFVRNSRLTASANDMDRRYQSDPLYKPHMVYGDAWYRHLEDGQPLPPLPIRMVRNPNFREGSADNGVQTRRAPDDLGGQYKNRGFYGK